MDRRQHDYAAPSGLPYAQQQVPNFQQQQQQQQQFGFHPQHQQYPPPPMNASNFMPPHPSMQQQFPYQQQLHHPPHPQMFNQQHPPHHHHLPPPFPGPYDSAPPPPPPADPELQKRIDKLVEYSVKNGPEFEAMMRDRQKDNPDYAFLFGGEGHGYYRYKQFISMHHPPGGAFDPQFPSPSMPMMHHPPNPMMSPGALGVQPIRQPPFPPFHEHQQHHLPQPHPFAPPPPHSRPDFDQSVHAFRGLSGPLPADVAVELNSVLANLNGTKDSIKSAKIWFMQRSPFAPALAEALRDRVFATDDSEKQMHIVYLANDILFDSLQRRTNLHEFDNEALAFRPVLGSMLGKIYHCPHNKEANQSRLENLLQFWASKEVFDQDTISTLDKEMRSGPPPNTFSRSPIIAANSLQHPGMMQQPQSSHVPSTMNLEHLASNPVAGQQFIPNAITPGAFPGSIPSVPPPTQPPAGEKQAPYPLFPPGLIPGMVRKMQVGSGVPYSPLSPLDIPTVIPPSVTPQSQVLERVSKFFKEIGEVNPSEGPMGSESQDDYDDYERDSPVRKGGACIPPPANLQVDPETGTYADGSTDKKSTSGRLGLGATADPNEPTQYDDVYTSYRKHRSTNYHTTMSARSTAR
ncbi:hypothetical protein IGI04_000626 [Brassica rapa subsp. trilocularis]|uniref:CID domain-containing protein n=1 Tax=Brassica rapa subsp. trilocularis TaxID=1813537 RepID=A0ABQ7NQA5_BRACM|nr:hypothetical protein IGI04_000626 [Brassica rapa subsp. trilocularis]